MGTLCPVCQTHQPFVSHLTRDQEPATKATDVIGHKLGCGHKVGGEKFNKFQEQVREIETSFANHVQKLLESKADKLAAAWETIQRTSTEGGAD